MQKRNKILLSTIGLLSGACIFSITAFVALANNSSYVAYKNSFFKTVETENYTVKSKIRLEDNEGIVTENETNYLINKDKSYVEFKTKLLDDDVFVTGTYSENTEDDTIKRIEYKDGKIKDEFETITDAESSDNPSFISLTDAQRKLIDISIDTVLGDVKNSILSEGNKIHTKLDEYQIPGLIKSGFAVFTEAYRLEYEKSPEYFLGTEDKNRVTNVMICKDLIIKRINFEGGYDDDGYIKYLSGDLELGGHDSNNNYLTVKCFIYVNVSNIGNTVVNKPDITEYHEIYLK